MIDICEGRDCARSHIIMSERLKIATPQMHISPMRIGSKYMSEAKLIASQLAGGAA